MGKWGKWIFFHNLEDFSIDNCFSTLNGLEGLQLGASSKNVNLTNVIAKNNNYENDGRSGIYIYNSEDVTLNSCQSYDERKVTGVDIAFVEANGGEDTITMGDEKFLIAGFLASYNITVSGSASNDGVYTILSIDAGTINVATDSLTTEAAGETVTITMGVLQYYGLELATATGVTILNCDLSPNYGGEITDASSTFNFANVNTEVDFGAHSAGFTLQSSTAEDSTTTIDWKLGNKYEFTFDDENVTFTFLPPTKPGNFMLWIIQDDTSGSYEITWPETCRWPGGEEGVLSTAVDSVDIVGIAWNGTYYDCVINNAFAVPE